MNYTNVTSQALVDKLNFPTSPCPYLYSLQWLKIGNEVKVTK